jgi:uncharacterized protein (TIGR03435 family)
MWRRAYWHCVAGGLILTFAPVCVCSQETPKPHFEVATIKPRKSTQPVTSVDLNFFMAAGKSARHGRFQLNGAPLTVLIELAYNVKDSQVLGAPEWVNTDGYDVVAKTDGDVDFEQMRPMLRTLLADRFGLAIRQETRQLPVYEMELAKGGVKLAATSPESCAKLDRDNAVKPPVPVVPATLRAANAPASPTPFCGGKRITMLGPGRGTLIEARGISMPALASMFSDQVGVPVVDKTALGGLWDVHLQFLAVEGGKDDPRQRSDTSDAGVAVNPSPVSLFTALQEQLGLRLRPARGPVEVLVIDHVDRPSEN